MACFKPLRGWWDPTPGVRRIRFTDRNDDSVRQVEVPCGQCVGCKTERARQWAVRCEHEASLYDRNCFITLTYADQFVPASGSLDREAFPKFMKRLRKRVGQGPRYFHCGEYGGEFGRPHYHACLFNYDFPDKVLWKEENGNKLYLSAMLMELWPFGFSTIGAVTFESALYVAKYCVKGSAKYSVMDPETGELVDVEPEYSTMSRRPGLGSAWFEKFSKDVYPDGVLVSRNGFKSKPPRFYDSRFEVLDKSGMDAIRLKRAEVGYVRRADSTIKRLKVREQIALAKKALTKRDLE